MLNAGKDFPQFIEAYAVLEQAISHPRTVDEIRAEVQQLKDNYQGIHGFYAEGVLHTCEQLLDFIDGRQGSGEG
jgi:hypothetical protein